MEPRASQSNVSGQQEGGTNTWYQTKVEKLTEVVFGPCPHRDSEYCIGSNFWKFYLIRIGFTLSEPVSLVEV
jgi:hypothetical protein